MFGAADQQPKQKYYAKFSERITNKYSGQVSGKVENRRKTVRLYEIQKPIDNIKNNNQNS